MQMSADIVRIVQSYKDHVLYAAAEIRESPCRHAGWLLTEPIIQDRNIVRCKAPQSIHVMLNPPKVHPLRIHIKELAEFSAVYVLLDPLDGDVILEYVADHQHPLVAFGQFDQLSTFSFGAGQRLLDQH